jgi:DNA-binding HxlR family transcriptional regulator
LSERQASDVLGDGWTIDIICHILKELKGQLDI